MANPEHLKKLNEGVAAWNEWRASQASTPDLSNADFSGKDLSRFDLRGVNFSGSNLSGADLREADLREADLQSADLSGVKGGLQTEQLAGADLTGAILPEELKKLYEALQNVNNISESASKLFLVVLAACLYSWLTIATTTDLNLIANRASAPLPIIQTSISIVGFYAVAPLLLLCVYFYFHFYLQKLWEELSSLPAILLDGRPLHTKIDSWLLNDLVRAHLPKLNVNRPFLSYFQLWISVLLAWWVVPITLFLFWGRYLLRHDRIGTTFHVALLTISLPAALRLYWLAVATLRGTERKPFTWTGMLKSRVGRRTAALAVAVGVLFLIVSWGARWGVPSNAPILGVPLVLQRSEQGASTRPLTWVPRLMALVGYSPFADLRGAEVSQKKSNWSKNEKDLDSVVRAQLRNANLRYALALNAFLAGADLSETDLSYADLSEADLSYADLSDVDLAGTHLGGADLSGAYLGGAHLSDTDLRGADLSGANLSCLDLRGGYLAGAHLSDADLSDADLSGVDLHYADLSGVYLVGAHLTYTDFRMAKNLNLETVKSALYWEKAFYDDETLKALGLPPDHNAELAEQQKKEKELQQKQDAGQTAPKPTPPKQ